MLSAAVWKWFTPGVSLLYPMHWDTMAELLDFMKPHILRDEAEYTAAVAEIERLLDTAPPPRSEACERLEFLSVLRPELRPSGAVVGMDSNYKNGLVFSDGQVVGRELYQRIQEFAKRQRNTHAEINSLLGAALKQLDGAAFKTLCIEDLKRVKSGKRGDILPPT